MAKPLHPDYIYIDAELLKERVAYHKPSGWLICESKGPDGNFVSYSPKELKVFMDAGEPITLAVHNVKKIIGGEVVESEIKSKEKLVPAKQPDGNAGSVEKVIPIKREGELDIY